MPKFYLPLVNWIRAHPGIHKLARSTMLMVPDLPITMNVPELGRFRFGFRRHRWLMGAHCFAGHALILGTFQHLIKPGDVFYDVGANIGYYTRFILAHFPVSHLVAFEPMTANLKMLRANIEFANCQDKVTLMPVALGDTNTDEELQIDDVGDGSAVLSRISGGQAAEPRRQYGLKPKGEIISVIRLDDAIARHHLPPPQVIKIDTEGAECIVLQGARQTLLQHRPRLAIALHGPQHARETLQLLGGIGYVCYGLVFENGQQVYRELNASQAESLADNNIVCSTDPEDVNQPIEPLDTLNIPRVAS
ncbi:MAG TPA: FkbM family methyltransferase [Tepidisphaeraceae bacterium]|nr:FkbM family methyltransferase [Tepidisphaeraceae bacterium]